MKSGNSSPQLNTLTGNPSHYQNNRTEEFFIHVGCDGHIYLLNEGVNPHMNSKHLKSVIYFCKQVESRAASNTICQLKTKKSTCLKAVEGLFGYYFHSWLVYFFGLNGYKMFWRVLNQYLWQMPRPQAGKCLCFVWPVVPNTKIFNLEWYKSRKKAVNCN